MIWSLADVETHSFSFLWLTQRINLESGNSCTVTFVTNAPPKRLYHSVSNSAVLFQGLEINKKSRNKKSGKMSDCIYLTNFYFCCSHLEYRVSVKHFVSLQFLNLRQLIGLLGQGIIPTQGHYLHSTTHRINADNHSCLECDSNPRSQCSNSRRHFLL
jgi:hypothetical protein